MIKYGHCFQLVKLCQALIKILFVCPQPTNPVEMVRLEIFFFDILYIVCHCDIHIFFLGICLDCTGKVATCAMIKRQRFMGTSSELSIIQFTFCNSESVVVFHK